MKTNIVVEENDKLEEVYTNIMNFEQAVNKALDFSRKSGHHFTKLISAVKEQDNTWTVKVDVGSYKKEIKTIELSAAGVVIGFK